MATLTPEMTNFLWGFCHEQIHGLSDGPFRQVVPKEQDWLELCFLMQIAGGLRYFDGAKTPEGYPPEKVAWPFTEVSVRELLDVLVPEHIKNLMQSVDGAKSESLRNEARPLVPNSRRLHR